MKEVFIHSGLGRLYLGSITEVNKILYPHNRFTEQANIRYIISLISDEEIAGNYPHLSDFLNNSRMKGKFWSCPVPPDGEPLSLKQYTDLLKNTTEEIKNGENFLVFCLNGMRRSRKFAETILILLGYSPQDAYARIWDCFPPVAGGESVTPVSFVDPQADGDE